MLSLEQSEYFKNDYNKFKEQIDLVKDLAVKAELYKLLDSLIVEVKKIDNLHKDFIFERRPLDSKEIKQTISYIRKTISEKLSRL